MTSVTQSEKLTDQDRALWQAYVRRRRESAPQSAGGDEAIDGENAILIASYLDHRLDEWAQAAFERRLVDEPQLLEAAIAAHAAVSGPAVSPQAMPQSVVAFALNLVPSAAPPPRLGASRPAGGNGRRPWLFASPAFAWSIATVAFVAFASVGVYVAIEHDGGTIAAGSPDRGESIADDLDRRNDSVFTDPAKTYFDGTEVDD